jgi:hypothetical protein
MMNKSKRMKLRSGHRGQIAVEFMSTYGWAILILMAALAALVYIMPSLNSLTNKKCIFGTGMTCLGTELTNAEFTISMRNDMGKTIYNVRAVTISPIGVSCTVDAPTASPVTLRTDQQFQIVCPNNPAGLGITSDSGISVNILYEKTRGGYDQISKGDIYAKYQ